MRVCEHNEPIEVVCPICGKALQVVPGHNAVRHIVPADAPCRECREADHPRGAVDVSEHPAPDRLWTNRNAGSIVTASPRLAAEAEALGDSLVEYVRADLHRGAVEPLRRYECPEHGDTLDQQQALAPYCRECRGRVDPSIAEYVRVTDHPRGAVDLERAAEAIASVLWECVDEKAAEDVLAPIHPDDWKRAAQKALGAIPRGAVDDPECSQEYHEAHLAFARADIVQAAANREPLLDRLRAYTADVVKAERDRQRGAEDFAREIVQCATDLAMAKPATLDQAQARLRPTIGKSCER